MSENIKTRIPPGVPIVRGNFMSMGEMELRRHPLQRAGYYVRRSVRHMGKPTDIEYLIRTPKGLSWAYKANREGCWPSLRRAKAAMKRSPLAALAK